MSKEVILDIIKVFVFLISWAVFTASFFTSGDLPWKNVPANGFVLLLCFMLTAWYDTLSGLANSYEERKGIKKLNVFEVIFGILVIVIGFMFSFAKLESFISVTGIICSTIYLIIKSLRLGIHFHKYIVE